MTLPTFVSAGTPASAAVAISPGLPASTQANDILLYFLETNGNEAITTDAAWTQVADSPQANGTTTRLTAFWLRHDGSTTWTTTTSDSGNHQLGVIIAIRGCITSGNPWDVTSGGTTASSTSLVFGGDTTTVNDCLVVVAGTNAGQTSASGEANSQLANLAERVDTNTSAGGAGTLVVYTGELATAGTYGNTTATWGGAGAMAWMSIALKPATSATGPTEFVGVIPI